MRKLNTIPPTPGLCSLQDLPEPYQCAFRQASAHHLPGRFLPAEVDWFTQIFILPFWLIYALPTLIFPLALFNPKNYGRLFQIVRQQTAVENTLMVGLFGLLGLLLVYCAWMAFDAASCFSRTWQAHRLQRHGQHGFGLVLLERGLVARLIDNIDASHNCFWLPREAITNIIWQRVREEGAKRSRWVYRTQLCYMTEHQGKQQKCWLTLKGNMVKMSDLTGDIKSDQALFNQLYDWWQVPE